MKHCHANATHDGHRATFCLVLVSQANFQNYIVWKVSAHPLRFGCAPRTNTPWLALSKPLSPLLFVVSLLVLRSAVASSQRTTPFYSLVSVGTRVHAPPDHIPSDLAPFWGGHIQRVLVWIQAQSTQVLHLCPLPPPVPPIQPQPIAIQSQ